MNTKISQNLLLFTIIVPPLSVYLRYVYIHGVPYGVKAVSGWPEQGSSISSSGNIVLEEPHTIFAVVFWDSPPSSVNWQRQASLDVPHCNENQVYVFPEKELCGLSPNYHIHVSVNDLYIPRIGPHILLSRIGRPIVVIYKSRRAIPFPTVAVIHIAVVLSLGFLLWLEFCC